MAKRTDYAPNYAMDRNAVYEECSKNSGAYVLQSKLEEHLNECSRAQSSQDENEESLEERIRSLQESVWKNKVVSILGLLRTVVYEGEKEIKELRDTLISSLQLTNEALRKDILEELYASRRASSSLKSRLSDLEKSCSELQRKTEDCSGQIENLRIEVASEQDRSMEEREKCYAVLEEIKADFTTESATIRRLWQEQLQNIHDMKLELEMRCKLSKELVNQYNALFDRVEGLDRRVQKHSEALTHQLTGWKTLKFQMKESAKYVDAALQAFEKQRREGARLKDCVCNCSGRAPIGRFLWRIDRYEEKMKEARERDTALVSPIFYDKEYGYTLRMELHLNGLGQWRNRHVIGCLRIVQGKWDPLLEWPCALRADVVLKDQENSMNDVEKFVKTVKTRKDDEEVEHNSDLYMFIPHTTLARHPGYTAGDVMFLDVRVREHKFKGSTMSLV